MTCTDNLPNSQKQFDVCGVCGGNGATCTGCDGIPNSGKVYPLLPSSFSPLPSHLHPLTCRRNDVCGVCGGDNSQCINKKPTFTNNNVLLWVVWGLEGIDRTHADLNDPFSEYLITKREGREKGGEGRGHGKGEGRGG